ncbi:MAG: hypothetical protein ABI651_16870, partial [Verrucomicrobiota bacterium]
VLRHLHISAGFCDVQSNMISHGFLEWESRRRTVHQLGDLPREGRHLNKSHHGSILQSNTIASSSQFSIILVEPPTGRLKGGAKI